MSTWSNPDGVVDSHESQSGAQVIPTCSRPVSTRPAQGAGPLYDICELAKCHPWPRFQASLDFNHIAKVPGGLTSSSNFVNLSTSRGHLKVLKLPESISLNQGEPEFMPACHGISICGFSITCFSRALARGFGKLTGSLPVVHTGRIQPWPFASQLACSDGKARDGTKFRISCKLV